MQRSVGLLNYHVGVSAKTFETKLQDMVSPINYLIRKPQAGMGTPAKSTDVGSHALRTPKIGYWGEIWMAGN